MNQAAGNQATAGAGAAQNREREVVEIGIEIDGVMGVAQYFRNEVSHDFAAVRQTVSSLLSSDGIEVDEDLVFAAYKALDVAESLIARAAGL